MHRPTVSPRLLVLLAVCAALCGALCAAIQASAQPGHPKGDHKHVERLHIEALEKQWRSAQLAGDATAMDKLLSEDFLGIASNGEVGTKEQFLDRMRNRTLTLNTMDVSEQKIKLVGQVAIVTSLAQIDGISNGQPLTGRFRYTRVYQRLPGDTWRVTNFEATRVPQPHRPGPASPDSTPH